MTDETAGLDTPGPATAHESQGEAEAFAVIGPITEKLTYVRPMFWVLGPASGTLEGTN